MANDVNRGRNHIRSRVRSAIPDAFLISNCNAQLSMEILKHFIKFTLKLCFAGGFNSISLGMCKNLIAQSPTPYPHILYPRIQLQSHPYDDVTGDRPTPAMSHMVCGRNGTLGWCLEEAKFFGQFWSIASTVRLAVLIEVVLMEIIMLMHEQLPTFSFTFLL